MSSVPSALLREENAHQEERAAEPAKRLETRRRVPRGVFGALQIVGILGLVSLAVVFSRESTPLPAAPPSNAGAPAAAAGQLVSVVMPTLTASQVTVEASGTVVVRSRVSLVPEVSGRVVSVSPALRAGGHFAAGEELLRIDAGEFQLALDQANAEMAIARSQLRLQQAESVAARKNYALVHPGKPVPDLVAKVPQLAQRQAEVAAARARVARAVLELSRTRFSLPFDGRVTASSAAVGQMLNQGQSFGEAFAGDALEIAVPMAQHDLARLRPLEGRGARVVANDMQADAVVERVSAELDPRTRFAKVFLTFDESVALPPGTFVSVTLQGPVEEGTFVLPEAAEQINGSFWVVDQGALRGVSPRIIARTAEGVIVEGFDAGDGVVMGAVPGARDGLAVRTDENLGA